MPETALLINPSRRRRRRARANPRRRRYARRNPFGGARLNKRRRRARRNPGFFSGTGGFNIAHAGGAGAYGLLKNGVRRMYWQGKDQPAERAAAIAKFNSHSTFVKAGIVIAGFALKQMATGKWSDVGEGMVLAGLADGAETLTENLGLTPEEKTEKQARQALDGAGVLVNGGGLASVLVERERQLRGFAAADDDELNELDPDDAFDDVNDDDFEADEDELY